MLHVAMKHQSICLCSLFTPLGTHLHYHYDFNWEIPVQISHITSSKHSLNDSRKSVAKRPRKFILKVKLDVLCFVGCEHAVHVGRSWLGLQLLRTLVMRVRTGFIRVPNMSYHCCQSKWWGRETLWQIKWYICICSGLKTWMRWLH